MKRIILDFSKTIKDIEITEDTDVLGIFIGEARQSLTTKFNIIHSKPGLKSRVKIKAVLYDESQFDCSPTLKINTGAKLTDSYLKIDALLVGKNAKARAVPSLEITENDVKGGHGATIGKLDKEQVFYLQTRGLSKINAEKLLIKAFIADIMEALTK